MTNIIDKIKELGVQDQQANELFELLSEEVIDVLFDDLTEKSTDEELAIIESRIKEAKSTEHFESIINEIAVTIYGDEAQTEVENIYLDLIDQLKENAAEAKDLINKANSGDPQAQELLSKAQQTEEFNNITGQPTT
jgi:hypothetical protein